MEPEVLGYFCEERTLYDHNGKIVMICHKDDKEKKAVMEKEYERLYKEWILTPDYRGYLAERKKTLQKFAETFNE